MKYKKSMKDGSLTNQKYAKWQENFFDMLQLHINHLLEDVEWTNDGFSKNEIKMTYAAAINKKNFWLLLNYHRRLKDTFDEFEDRQEFANLPLWIHPSIMFGRKFIYIKLIKYER